MNTCFHRWRSSDLLSVFSLLFVLLLSLPGCSGEDPAEGDWTRRGMTAYGRGDYAEAVGCLERAFRLSPEDAALAHNLACCYALLGENEKALQYVERSLALGSCLFLGDEDLKSLREEPRFRQLSEEAVRLLEELKSRTWTPEIVLPEGYDPGNEYPWIIALHGFGGSPEPFSRYLRKVSNETGAIVCCPYATVPHGCASFSWSGYPEDEETVLAALDYLRRNYPLREDGGVILGYSQGGSRAFYLGLKHPELFRGIVVLAGHYDEEFDPLVPPAAGRTRVSMVIGAEDRLLESNRRALELLEASGIPAHLVVLPGLGHTAPSVEEVIRAIEWIGNSSSAPTPTPPRR